MAGSYILKMRKIMVKRVIKVRKSVKSESRKVGKSGSPEDRKVFSDITASFQLSNFRTSGLSDFPTSFKPSFRLATTLLAFRHYSSFDHI